jgi:sulfite exporter TauE/SafE
VALPCSLLAQILSLSVLSGSVYGGGLIGLMHANTSTLGLWMGTRSLEKVFKKIQGFQWLFKAILLVLMVFNLFYFAGVLFHTEEVSKSKILFCF